MSKIAGWFFDYEQPTWHAIVGIVGTVVLGVVFLGGTLMWVVEQSAMPSSLARIEQLRGDSQGIDPQQAEDVVGQITEWNQAIASKQALNQTWWAGWAIPDEWDRIELIPVPR